MTYYDSFDCKINCEELILVTPEEEAEVLALIHQENEAQRGFTEWLASLEQSERAAFLEQQAFERREAQHMAWFNGYSNRQEGESYNGIAI
jgi:hypothetical protein